MKEIERKFLMKDNKIPKFFNDLKSKKMAIYYQSYISINPEIRIREKFDISTGTFNYILCFKSNGSLIREEVEISIDKSSYFSLMNMIDGDAIIKDYIMYDYNGYNLEFSIVDGGQESTFMYAEIEFESEEEANKFIVPDEFFEVTNDEHWKMKNYWKRTRLNKE